MYESIAKNKRKSWFVFFGMGLLLLAMGGLIGFLFDPNATGGKGIFTGIVLATVLWFILAIVSMVNGAQVMLQGMNAKEIAMENDPVLHNVIEELTIASGLPMPKIYVIDTPALNAFAAGTKPEKSIVAITRGLREKLTRQEMQAVMAHEMSHIYNRDVMYMTFAGVMLCSIVIISDLMLRTFIWGGGRRSNSKEGNGAIQLVIIAAVILLAILAPLFAQLFYFSLSRKREYLADTMAVNFTRDPDSLANALEKISGNTEKFDPGHIAAAMCINKPKTKKTSHRAAWFSTHPPIAKRIAILRAMSMGTDYNSYCAAYAEVTGKDDLPKQKAAAV
ncbi:MAG: M48 family metallopeptidase [Bacteroidales bacterium]|jgi:heat shock protein HtpX|nr:M48 family metallopeptidase [Bacteroidales bacterium]